MQPLWKPVWRFLSRLDVEWPYDPAIPLQYLRAVWEVSRTTLRFNNSLAGLTELRKAIVLMVLVYYSKRMQIKNSKGERHIGQGPGEILFRDFIKSWWLRHSWPPAWLTGVSSPSRGQTDPMWPKASTINHSVSVDYLTWPRTPDKLRHSYQSGHSRGLEVTS